MIIGHWQTVSIFSSCHAPLSSTTSLHFHPRPSRPSSPTNCLMKDPTCSSTWAIVHGPSLGNSTVKNMARIDVLCKKKQWSNGGQYQQYLIILYHIIICFFSLLGPKLSQWFFVAQAISKLLGRAGALHIIWRGADQKVSCWDNSTINGCFHGNIHYRWRFEQDNPP